MSDHPEHPDQPDDPFAGLPDELRRMVEQLGGPGVFQQVQSMLHGAGTGPVNWELAQRVALQLAAEDDRSATPEERDRATEALRLAEHWLDDSSLPAPPDSGSLVVATRQEWVNAAITAMRPLVEPVATASARAMSQLAQDQMGNDDVRHQLDAMGLGGILDSLGDLSSMIQPMGAMMTGMQAGQVLGQLSRQLLGQYELGIPTAPRSSAFLLAVNLDDAFGDWDLDPTEVAITVCLHEAAHRRLYHAVPWLEAHVQGLVAQFANGMEIDPERLQGLSQELMGVDPDDPDSMREAMARASDFRIEPTPPQRRVLERIQGVLVLVQAWARSEVARAAGAKLPNLPRIEEVLRRRRVAKGDGEQLLEQLLGLDLKPEDETVGEGFVAAVEQARGPEGLRRALAHPENLPDAEELAEPSRWLVRMAGGEDIPDDPSALFDGLGDAPIERSYQERFDEQGRDASEPDDDPTDDDPEDV